MVQGLGGSEIATSPAIVCCDNLVFNWRPVTSQLRSIAYPLLVNAALCGSAHRRLGFLRKAAARTGHIESTANVDGEIAEAVVLFPRRHLRKEAGAGIEPATTALG